MSALTDLIGKELGPTEWFEVDAGADRPVRGGDRRPAVDPHRPRARGGRPVRDDGRPRVPDPVAVRAADDADARADRLLDGRQLRRQQGAVPGARALRLAHPRAVHRPDGRGGRGRRAGGRARDGRARGWGEAGLRRRAGREDVSDEPLRGEDGARHGRREGNRRRDRGAPRLGGRARRRRRLRRAAAVRRPRSGSAGVRSAAT